ncbi:MAG TPA: hypothetical protein PKO15_06660 [Fibrobacteria bacterium]|nr:hypothetical protein [Fibrobacteria bacterium]HOX50459.1 hypothetical protein [Fibrobacteria bacterium]
MNVRILAILLVLAGILRAQAPSDVRVEATGFGPSVEAATRSAQRAAVEKGIGQVIQSQTELENYQLKKDLVLTRTEGAVKSFETKKREQGPDGAWEVTIDAVVSKAQIRSDLLAMAILRSAVGNPRVSILVKESLLGVPRLDGAVEHQVTQAFLDREFKVMNPSGAMRTERAREMTLAQDGDTKVASALGQEMGAEVVIVGTAQSQEADMSRNPMFKNSGMKSVSGTVVLKAIDVQTREILATATADEAVVHPNPSAAGTQALEKAAKKALETARTGIIDQLVRVWQNKANNGMQLKVTVKAIPNFAASQIVEEDLRSQAVSAETTRFADRTLSMDVVWRGTMADFCQAMDGRRINKDRNTLNVVSREGNAVVLEVK